MKKVLVAGSEGFIGKNLVCEKATTFLGVKNEKRFSNLWQSCN
jgi:nucleoside-diphosphate-sugar epimerase